MITGANTNVRYRGVLFHVQTEDSGRANPHIISHVYHGGTILGTHKTDYSDQLESEDLTGTVRGLIEHQHASMLQKLHGGGFDEVIRQRLGDDAMSGEGASTESVESKPDTEPEVNAPRSGLDVAASTQREVALPVIPGRRAGRSFGEGVGSQQPLDEVILDYLSQKARTRTGERTGSPAPKSRSRG